jgi:hypothetical protein
MDSTLAFVALAEHLSHEAAKFGVLAVSAETVPEKARVHIAAYYPQYVLPYLRRLARGGA